jgi:hypothetical protein
VSVSEESIGGPVTCPACGSTFTAKPGETGSLPPKEEEGFRFTPLSSPEGKSDEAFPQAAEDESKPPERFGRKLHEAALRQIKSPASALLSAGILTCVMCPLLIILQGVLLWLVTRGDSIFPGFAAGPPSLENLQIILAAGAILVQIVGIGLGITIIRGARSMKKLEGYRRSMTCSILSMVTVFVLACPCSSCTVLGLPFGMWAVAAGIWSIVALCKPEVKEAFRINDLQEKSSGKALEHS